MAKSSLAYIDQAAESTLGRESTAPTLTPSALKEVGNTARSRIAGFVVHDAVGEDAAIERAKNARLGRIQQYRRDRDSLRKELAEKGLTPLAMLPTTAWEKICLQSGLIRLSPDSDGEISVSSQVLSDLMLSEKGATAILWTIAIVPAVAQLGWSMLIGYPPYWEALFLSFLTGVVAGLVIGAASWFSNEMLNKKLRELVQSLVFSARVVLFGWQSWSKIIKALFPDGVEPDYGVAATLVLPQPPQEFLDMLLKARGMRVHVAAEAAAIGFTDHPVRILRREGVRRLDLAVQERIQREQNQAEPVAYVQKGLATAILGQFGEFPVEQRVVDMVMTTDFVP